MSSGSPLIELIDIHKSYGGGDAPVVEILHGINLRIQAGEFVAIVGASGSGKSTLMNLLGCLDRPTSGQYRFAGQDIARLGQDELAWLRREAFGFVFQGYHLIRTATARENVELPAIYAGTPAETRSERARALIERLGLGDRLEFRPHQLSGGQQQRVSIARALMNGGQIILADEPTGALDSHTGAEVMSVLDGLARAGHTIILISHDHDVAAKAKRVIELRDGRIVSDRRNDATPDAAGGDSDVFRVTETLDSTNISAAMAAGARQSSSGLTDAREVVRAAWRVMHVNRFRTLLTLLGIIIGVASVIVMLAVGAGTQREVIAKMASFGTNRLYVMPGSHDHHVPGGVLTQADADLVRGVINVTAAMPFLDGEVTLRADDVDIRATFWAVTSDAPRVLNWQPSRGTFFTPEDERRVAPVLLLGKGVRERLFPDSDPIGRYVLVNHVPFQVIGELEEKGATSGDSDDDDLVMMPFSTGSRRIAGTLNLSWISVLVDNVDRAQETADEIERLLEKSHRIRDFHVFNKAAAVKAQKQTQQTLTVTLGLIAAISLLVGGIGVMNIMLVTVKERTREIGIRMATGARHRDILRQFLTEAVLVSLVGGVLGIIIGLVIGMGLIFSSVPIIFSARAIVAAFACAVATGLVFGFMPARQAAALDPVVALTAE